MSALSDLQAVMFQWRDQMSVIKPALHQRTGCYRLQLVEDFGTVDDAGNSMPSRGLDECVKWVEETLQDQANCKRMAWDMWDFDHRRDAEKFITLFHLSWAQ